MENSEAENPNPHPSWVELPADVTDNILRGLGTEMILEAAQKVCTHWWRVCKDPSMWRVIDIRRPTHFQHSLSAMCRHAVDRSQGQLADLNIEHFGSDQLLLYIGERCKLLKRLRLVFCSISVEALAEAVKNFQELEELHIYLNPSFSSDAVKNICTSCPKLKSLTFSPRMSFFPRTMAKYRNRNALGVAKSLSNLPHLRLFEDQTSNEGLEAIINSFPHLESLHIGRCFIVSLIGDLGARCLHQLKFLRCPNDCIYDCNGLLATSDDEGDGEGLFLYYTFSEDYDLNSDFSDDYSDDFSDDYSDDSSDDFLSI